MLVYELYDDIINTKMPLGFTEIIVVIMENYYCKHGYLDLTQYSI